MGPFKNNIWFEGFEYIVTGIAASPTGYTAILVIMSFSAIKTDVILCRIDNTLFVSLGQI